MKCAKVLRWGLVLGVLLSLAAARVAVAGDCEPWSGKIVSAKGSVQAQRAGGADWRPVVLDDTLCIGDALWVGDTSRATVLDDGLQGFGRYPAHIRYFLSRGSPQDDLDRPSQE